MPDNEQLRILLQGVPHWNAWRREHPEIRPDLTGADLTSEQLYASQSPLVKWFQGGTPEAPIDEFYVDLRLVDFSNTLLSEANLQGADLSGANLANARFGGAKLQQAQIDRADLSGAYLREANLSAALMRHSNLRSTNLQSADLVATCLAGSDLTDADLTEARMIRTDFREAALVNCRVFGTAVWDVNLDGAVQSRLQIVASLSVDDLGVAQFLSMLMRNDRLRNTIDVITRKIVLILGRFSETRKPVLEAIRQGLGRYGYVPIIFDFHVPVTRNMTETVSTLAHLSRFVIADITDAGSVPQELQQIVPNLPSVPVAILLARRETEYGMFGDFRDRPNVLEPCRYDDADELLSSLEQNVIAPAEARAIEIQETRRDRPRRS